MQQRIADRKDSRHEKTIVVKEHGRARYNFDPTMLYENRFWNRRPDDKYHRTLYILEFKRSSDRNKGFLRVKEDEANNQHRSIIEALRAAAPEWTFKFEQINFVAGRNCNQGLKAEFPCLQIANRDLKLKFMSIRKVKTEEER